MISNFKNDVTKRTIDVVPSINALLAYVIVADSLGLIKFNDGANEFLRILEEEA